MRKFTKISLSLAVASVISLTFVACGGGSSSTDDTQTVSGKVADGYLDKAKICLDKNLNGICETTEPNTLSLNGNYNLKVDKADVGKYPILVEVTTSTVDLDDNLTVTNGYTLTAPKDSTGFISPITTLIQSEIEKCPVLSKDEATSKVAQKLNLTSSDIKLLTDYVANNSDSESSKLHEVGKVVAKLQGELEVKLTQTSVMTENNKKASMNQILDNIYKDINNTSAQIKNGTLASGINTTNMVTNINISNDDVTIATKDLELKKSGTIDKMSSFTEVTFFGFDADSNHNSIDDVKVESAIFKNGNIIMGRDDLSNGVSSVITAKNNITNAPEETKSYTINNDGSIFVSDWGEIFVRFSKIDLENKTYTVKEIIKLMSDGFSLKETDVTSKLNNSVTFTNGDEFYMYITTNNGNYSSTGYKLNESAMTKIVQALQ